jgi:hypothetical protein
MCPLNFTPRKRSKESEVTMTARSIWTLFFVTLALLFAPHQDVARTAPAVQKKMLPVQSGNQRRSVSAKPSREFVSARVVSARDVKYPLETTADGIVVFNVSLDARGTPKNMNALTDIPPLTNAALSSLRMWKFAPAWSEGAPEASQLLVAFVFRHAIKVWSPPVFNSVFAPKEQEGYMPPGIFSASYVEYPSSTIAASATVVQATVKADGIVGTVDVVRTMRGGFVAQAITATKNWQFEPAMLNGTPVESKVAIAFVFSSRALNPF